MLNCTVDDIIEILPEGTIVDKITTYDEYLESDEMARKRQGVSHVETEEEDPSDEA